jgi:nucleobase:cation symporter-1, NCS1 family
LGPVAGVMFADYFIIRKCTLAVEDLYKLEGQYTYYKGYNYRAFVATGLGALISLIGQFVPSLKNLYDISWFIGVFVAFVTYTILMRVHPPVSITTEKVTEQAV